MKITVTIEFDNGQVQTKEIDPISLKEEALKDKAEEYAENENSCYNNDYYGFYNGANHVVKHFIGELREIHQL
jgi:hypothetical protein